MHKIPFNSSNYNQNTIDYISQSLSSGHTSGDGVFTKKCSQHLENNLRIKLALITHSCTAALEIGAILANIKPGDEVIMPSFTFVSTANAFVLRGAKIVFIDIRDDNCNMDECLIEQAITKKTKAIVPVHYAGVACQMDKIMAIARKNNLFIIEDAAQAYGSCYKDKSLGSIGNIGTLSFHETKNIISGEGGALLVNDESMMDRAYIIREKGTNRHEFLNGQIDKYSWVDIGSSYLPSDIISAYLYSNLEIADKIQAQRIIMWNKYYDAFKEFAGKVRLPFINDFATNNGHMFYLRFNSEEIRNNFIKYMKEFGILTPFHYIPLHSSPLGKKYGKISGEMVNTNRISKTLVRLPLFYDLSNEDIDIVISKVINFIKKI
jgi:dTDP-4-amino-4,6-dideoxygalactose transaminase